MIQVKNKAQIEKMKEAGRITGEALLLGGEAVKPGVTGYWQAYARNRVCYENGERQQMELYYAEKHSFWLDIRILSRTVVAVITKTGAK